MAGLADLFAHAFRDYVTDGVPGSGANKPLKSELRALGASIDSMIAVAEAGFTSYATTALRDADTTQPDGAIGYVYRNNGDEEDPANGFYQWNDGGSVWEPASWLIAPVELPDPLTDPVHVALGTIATSTPGLTIASVLNDGFGPGDARERFVGAFVDFLLTNVGDKPHSFFEGRVGGSPVIQLTPATAGYNASLLFLKPGTPDDVVSVEHKPSGNGLSLCHRIDPNSGIPAAVATLFWDSVNAGSGANSVAVLAGQGLQRFILSSVASMNMESGSSRYEREGVGGDGTLLYEGYDIGSANGRPFHYTNLGQTPSRANPVVKVSVQVATDKALSIGSNPSGTVTEHAWIKGSGDADFDGRVNAARLCTDTYTVATLPSSPQVGDRAYVTDASGPTWGATVAGSGSTKCPVTYDGTNWKVG